MTGRGGDPYAVPDGTVADARDMGPAGPRSGGSPGPSPGPPPGPPPGPQPGPAGPPPGPPPPAGTWNAPPPEPTLGERLIALRGRVNLRWRLTLIYGALFFVAGVVLVGVNAFIMMRTLRSLTPSVLRGGVDGTGVLAQLRAQWDNFLSAVLREQLYWSILTLMIIGGVALMLGYFAASRALAPLQRMTSTARRLSERSLHQRIDLQGPEDEVKELADTFDGMLERLDRAFDGQRRFVGNASHELRTPLAINRTLLEVALADPEASDDLRVLGRTLLATNERHERLIDGLLMLARSERELTTAVPVDLEEVCATVLGQIADEIDGAELSVERDLGHGVTRGDPVLLERLVWNLLENAVRYNTEGGEVVVRSGVYEGFAAIQIENSGQVIPAYEVEGLFEPFRRGQGDRLGSSRGAGLGLSIVRSVAQAHGGTVAAWPRDGGGLVVTVRLPRTRAEQGPHGS